MFGYSYHSFPTWHFVQPWIQTLQQFVVFACGMFLKKTAQPIYFVVIPCLVTCSLYLIKLFVLFMPLHAQHLFGWIAWNVCGSVWQVLLSQRLVSSVQNEIFDLTDPERLKKVNDDWRLWILILYFDANDTKSRKMIVESLGVNTPTKQKGSTDWICVLSRSVHNRGFEVVVLGQLMTTYPNNEK